MKSYDPLVIMVDSRRLNNFNDLDKANYNELSCIINSSYCFKHNYAFKYLRINSYLNNWFDSGNGINSYSYHHKETRSSSWCKLLAIAQEMNLKYDYIIYIDSDCIFKNHNIKLDSYIEKLKISKKEILMFADKPYHNDLPTAGFIIIKNNKEALKVINSWWNNKSNFGYKHPFEQHSLQDFYNKKNINITSKILLLNEWQFKLESKDQFLIHLNSEDDYLRIPFFKYFVKHNKILHNPKFKNYLDAKLFCNDLPAKKLSLLLSNDKHNLTDTFIIYYMHFIFIPIYLFFYEFILHFIKKIFYYLYPFNRKLDSKLHVINLVNNKIIDWKNYIKKKKRDKDDLIKTLDVLKE